jgi:hypothetical protein
MHGRKFSINYNSLLTHNHCSGIMRDSIMTKRTQYLECLRSVLSAYAGLRSFDGGTGGVVRL